MRLTLDQDFYRNLFTQELYQRRLNRYRLHNADEISACLLANGVTSKMGKMSICDLTKVAHVRRQGLSISTPILPNNPAQIFDHQTLYPTPLSLLSRNIRSDHESDESDEEVQKISPRTSDLIFKGLQLPQVTSPNIRPQYQTDGMCDIGHPGKFTNLNVQLIFTNECPEVIQLMNEFPGQVFIAGGSLYSIYRQGNLNASSDIDIFICTETQRKAEIIISRGTKLLEDALLNSPYNIVWMKTEVSPMVVTCYAGPSFMKVQFIRRLYPAGRPDMIVGAFDIHACQIFWSISTGIQCTTAALVSLLTQSFPLDLSRRSFSFGNRLQKYINEKHCDLILPGVNLENIPEQFGILKGKEGQKEIFTRSFPGSIQFTLSSRGGSYTDYEGYELDDEKMEEFNKETEADFYRNMKALLREGTNVAMKMQHYAQFCTGELNFVDAVLGESSSFENMQKSSPQKFRSMFKSPESYRAFIMAHFAYMDYTTSRRIWEQNLEEIVAYLKPLFGEGCDPSQHWKIDDPGAQGFGQNFPRPIAPREYYKEEHYTSIQAGLSHFSCWAIRQIVNRHFMPRDVFKMLCYYTFKAEAELAFHKLDLF